MPTFDRELLSATIDRNGIAWVSYAGPPYTLWQMVESDAAGTVKRRSSSDSQDVLEPIVRAGPCHWKLCVQYCGDGEPPAFPLSALAIVFEVGVNTLSKRFPAISAERPTTAGTVS